MKCTILFGGHKFFSHKCQVFDIDLPWKRIKSNENS